MHSVIQSSFIITLQFQNQAQNRKIMASKVLPFIVMVLIGIFFVVSLQFAAAAADEGCPKVTPVPIDGDFMFNKQPKAGFYAPYSSGSDTVPKYTAKPVDGAGFKGPNKLCVRMKPKIAGKELSLAPPVECSYASASGVFCDPSSAGVTAAAALAAVGMKLPKATTGSVVDTDNSTFYAFATCVDGALYQWAIYSTTPKLTEVSSKTLEALHIDEKELKESSKKKFTAGATRITKGPCSKSGGGGGPNAEDMKKISEGLSNLFGG